MYDSIIYKTKNGTIVGSFICIADTGEEKVPSSKYTLNGDPYLVGMGTSEQRLISSVIGYSLECQKMTGDYRL